MMLSEFEGLFCEDQGGAVAIALVISVKSCRPLALQISKGRGM